MPNKTTFDALGDCKKCGPGAMIKYVEDYQGTKHICKRCGHTWFIPIS